MKSLMNDAYPSILPELKVFYLCVVEYDLHIKDRANIVQSTPVKIVAEGPWQAGRKACQMVPWRDKECGHMARVAIVDKEGSLL